MAWTETDLAQMLARGGARVVGETQLISPAPDDLEDAFLGRVRRLALETGWLFYHTRDSRRSDEGYPDCTMTKPGRLIFAELKTRTGKPTHEQEVWLDVLRHSVPGVEVYLWRPQDWPQICAILTRNHRGIADEEASFSLHEKGR